MGSYPWGPHGPQSGPNQVTPNPTPAYVPPPPQPTYYPPAPSGPAYSGGGGSSTPQSVGYSGPICPRKKHYWIAVPLAFFFGPLGLFYASKRGALFLLFALFALPVGLAMKSMIPGVPPAHPFFVYERESIMMGFWNLSVMASLAWSLIAVFAHNRSV